MISVVTQQIFNEHLVSIRPSHGSWGESRLVYDLVLPLWEDEVRMGGAVRKMQRDTRHPREVAAHGADQAVLELSLGRMSWILFDGTAGSEARWVQPGQSDSESEDPVLGIHKSSLRDGGSFGLEQMYVGGSGDR